MPERLIPAANAKKKRWSSRDPKPFAIAPPDAQERLRFGATLV
jgi:hypothetical protein